MAPIAHFTIENRFVSVWVMPSLAAIYIIELLSHLTFSRLGESISQLGGIRTGVQADLQHLLGPHNHHFVAHRQTEVHLRLFQLSFGDNFQLS